MFISFEKMVSGMYLGEIVRQILEELKNKSILLNGAGSDELSTPKAFKTAFISAIENDAKDENVYTRQVMAEMNLRHATEVDFDIVKLVSHLRPQIELFVEFCLLQVCSRVSTRAAHLVSAAVATILNKMARPYTTVAVDGSVYKYHPHFHGIMEKKTCELVNPAYKFDIRLSEDGSGRGAGLVAALATQQEIRRKISTGQMLKVQPVNRKNSRMELKQFLKNCNEIF